MNVQIIPLISFVIITTFTPGPNNISSASMGIMYGYKKTFHYLAGITSGFFIVMLACAYLSRTILGTLPVAEQYLRWIGAGYIIWLAVGVLRSEVSVSETKVISKPFVKGLLLQLLNPKVAVYGLTLYSTFLAPISDRSDYLLISAMLFALIAFTATSTWALFGVAIRTKLTNDTFRRTINVFLALLLIYTAMKLSGIMS